MLEDNSADHEVEASGGKRVQIIVGVYDIAALLGESVQPLGLLDHRRRDVDAYHTVECLRHRLREPSDSAPEIKRACRTRPNATHLEIPQNEREVVAARLEEVIGVPSRRVALACSENRPERIGRAERVPSAL
jgi:hypothetical protein